jgi:DNA helicase-2/ATP-dependent DNA helicase PcrA
MSIENILQGLNREQRQAAEAVDGAYLVVAGAGSGKTTVLSRRVAALVEAGINPSSILLLTFTRFAAKNMLDRAKRITPAAADVVGGTYHSIAHRLVLENHRMFRLPEKPTFLDPDDVTSAFKKIALSLGGKDENMPKGSALAKAHSFSVNTKRSLEDVVHDRFHEFSYAVDFFQKCAEEYKTYKRTRGLLDYDDLLVAWDNMMDHPVIGAAVRDRFKYVLVDEDQDSNAIQCSIVAKLGGDNPNVMVVGDPAQSIYAFRGAAPRTMFEFIERWPHATTIKLNTNYRSTEEILTIANSVDRDMRERFDRELLPAPGSVGETPIMTQVVDYEAEAKYIADKILDRKDDGVDLEEQAILVRSMNTARHIEAELVRRRIPYKVSGGIKINDAAHIKDMLCMARCAANPLDEPAWLRVLTMARTVGEKKASQVYTKIADAVSESFLGDPCEIIVDMCKKSPDAGPISDAYRILAAGGPPVEILERAMTVVEDIFKRRYDDWSARKSDISAVIGLAEGQESLDSFLSTMSLDYSIDKKREITGEMQEENPVTISTVHSAKGLEWDVVYIPSFIQGHLPSAYANSYEQIEEEKRVLYVAVTRPRKFLEITKPTTGYKGVFLQQSNFEYMIAPFCEHQKIGVTNRNSQSFAFGFEDDYVDIFG